MPKADNPQPTSPTDASDESRFHPTHPGLVPDEDSGLQEGDSILTFVAPPPDNDE
jgi:hypothetical protein